MPLWDMGSTTDELRSQVCVRCASVCIALNLRQTRETRVGNCRVKQKKCVCCVCVVYRWLGAGWFGVMFSSMEGRITR